MQLLMSIVKQSMVFLVVTVTMLILVEESETAARPVWLDEGVFNTSATCESDYRLMELCQRCAKLTKSRLAYPECCSSTILARKWCSDYLNFGNDK